MPPLNSKKPRSARLWLLAFIFILGIAAIVLAQIESRARWTAPPEIKSQKSPFPAGEATIAQAKAIYADRCARCHGEKGDGKGSEAKRLWTEPTDFTDVGKMGQVSDGELFWRIGVGRRPMPSFENRLTPAERWELVNYIRTFVAGGQNSPDSAPSGSQSTSGPAGPQP